MDEFNQEMLTDFTGALKEFEPELAINKYGLDGDIAKQPDLYWRVSERAAEATSYRDRAKHELAITEAEAAEDIRSRAKESGEKLTEAGLKEQLTLDRKVVDAYRLFLSWDRAANEWRAMERSFSDREKMLRDMAQLYASGYFSITSAGNARDDVKEARAQLGRRALTERRQEREKLSR